MLELGPRPGRNGARSAESPPPCWTPSPAPCDSTTPSGPTCSTSPTPPTAPAPPCAPAAAAPRSGAARSSLQWTLDSITAPAIVGNNRSDLLATNHLGRALYADVYNPRDAPPNFARFTFLDGAAHRFYPDWDLAADITVANLRTAAGQDPHDKNLHDLVGELSTRSDEFRRRWGAHNVRTHGTGTKHFHHHIVGDLALAYESLDLRAEPGLTMTIYAAEPNSPTANALALLASWVATHHLEHTPEPT